MDKITTAAITLVKLYQKTLGPLFGNCCRFYPSCSTYAIESLQKYGYWKGGWLIIKRVVRCQPLYSGGIDPVP